MKEKWDDRYSSAEFAYGEEPNNYLKDQLAKLAAGTILFPAEGEGRNAVYAATLGWHVYAFDQSTEGKRKAMQLANKQGVEINYEVGELGSLNFEPEQFDAMALIYAHFPADVKSAYNKKLITYLKPGGIVIFEAFSKNHFDYVTNNPKVGGPKEIDVLFSIEEITEDFKNFDFIEFAEKVIEVNEGLYHIGKGSVIRFVGTKK